MTAVGGEGYVQLWDHLKYKPVGSIQSYPYPVQNLFFSSGDQLFCVLSGSDKGVSIRIWESRFGLPCSTILQPQFYFMPIQGAVSTRISGYNFNVSFEAAANDDRIADQAQNFWLGAELLLPTMDVPKWFHDSFLPLMAEKQISTEGRLTELTPDELMRMQKLVSKEAKNTPYESLVTRFLKL